MIKVKFYGDLKKFGSEFSLDVKDTAEAIRALCSQIKGLRQKLQQGYYKVRIGRDYINPEALEEGLFYCLKSGHTLHFTPVIRGAKNGGIFNIVAGAVLVAASWWAGGAAGWGYLGAAGYGMATMGTMLGASMILGGISQLLTKTPTVGSSDSEESEKKNSTSFSNLNNMAAQGKPVPLAYGLIRTGSLIISQGVETVTIKTNAAASTTTTARKGFMKG